MMLQPFHAILPHFTAGAYGALHTCRSLILETASLTQMLLTSRSRTRSGPKSGGAGLHRQRDASFEQGRGGTGGILFEWRGLLLRWFSEWHSDVRSINPGSKKGLIFELELAAVLMGLSGLCSNIRRADVIIFCDNEAVVGALVSGKSDVPIASVWLHRIFEIEEKQDLCFWFERVPSEPNPADEPSRGLTNGLPVSVKVSTVLPSS